MSNILKEACELLESCRRELVAVQRQSQEDNSPFAWNVRKQVYLESYYPYLDRVIARCQELRDLLFR